MAETEQNPLEQIAEAVLYAPIGLVYEYKNVVPTLVRRGKSQVQIAKLMGTMAAREGQRQASKLGVDALIGEVVSTAATTVAKGITDVGVMVGLAPDDAAVDDAAPPTVIDVDEAPAESVDEAAAKPTAKKPTAKKSTAKKPAAKAPAKERAAKEPAAKPVRLPIARYDDLKAREIIPLLDDLSPAQRTKIRAHESAGRGRKTVLAKLDRLEN